MKLQSTLYNVGYPVYGARFLNANTLLVTGGGGEGNHGIPNKLTALQINFSKKKIVKRFRELTLDENDDSPTTLDVAQDVILMGCNENSEKIRQGAPNHHLRKFVYENEHLKFVGAIDLNRSDNPEDYTKLLYMSQDGWVAAVASSAVPTVIRIVNPGNLRETYEVETGNDVKDLHFSSDGKVLAYITASTLEVISIVTGNFIVRKTDFDKNLSLSKIRFIGEDTLLIAAALKKGTGIVLTKLSLKKGNTQILRTCVITKKFKSVTSMDVDPKGQLAVLAGSDNSLALVKLRNFSVAKFFKQVHTFAVTRVVFSPDSRLLVSVSAANTVHVVQLPEDFATRTTLTENLIKFFTNFVLVVLVALFARFAHQHGLHTKAYNIVSNTLRKPENRRTSFFSDILNQQITLSGDVVSSSTTAVDTVHSSVDTSGWYLDSTRSGTDAVASGDRLDGGAATIESLAKSAGVDSPVEVETLPHANSTTFSEVTAYTGEYPEVVSSATSEVAMESSVDSKFMAIEASTTPAITISTSLQSMSVSDVYTGTSAAEDASSTGSDASVVLEKTAILNPSSTNIAEDEFVDAIAEPPSASVDSTPYVTAARDYSSEDTGERSEPTITEYKTAIESPSTFGDDNESVFLVTSADLHPSVSSASQTLTTEELQAVANSHQYKTEVQIVKQDEDEVEDVLELDSPPASLYDGDVLKEAEKNDSSNVIPDDSIDIDEYLDENLVKNFTLENALSLDEIFDDDNVVFGEEKLLVDPDLEFPELTGMEQDMESDYLPLIENGTEAVLQLDPNIDDIDLDNNMVYADDAQPVSDGLQNIAIMPDVIDNLEIQTFSEQEKQQLEPSSIESVATSLEVPNEATTYEVEAADLTSSVDPIEIVIETAETAYNDASPDIVNLENTLTSTEQQDSAPDINEVDDLETEVEVKTEFLEDIVDFQHPVETSAQFNVPKTPALEVIDQPQPVTQVQTVIETVVDGTTRPANALLMNSTVEVITVKEIVKETVFVTEKVTN
ncbi:AAR048Wp [Eremothecium gossypii ATCC 10895]|uniref:Guanine nucleotide-exchange factor SEC12 n=1 Tax=Eremothecium gossypii (strain ATCC 10895 / CBS 109.51 / FGSC 9923 / NRRL Y-1056) TaxID=284811 RepID=Q75EN1_EREGS|nr:AAR048Wp [Eremothecium gossypii ATCC 10895]AAS50413.1 AAR048Wp [Eremothecium gossypii ATCC 10895]AEY94699.1 FAAR048Wp [Eremothecium gossypii FDAG1]